MKKRKSYWLPPFYFPVGAKYGTWKGPYLAIWNCANCKRYSNLWYCIQDTRITIRKNGNTVFVIKKGAI